MVMEAENPGGGGRHFWGSLICTWPQNQESRLWECGSVGRALV